MFLRRSFENVLPLRLKDCELFFAARNSSQSTNLPGKKLCLAKPYFMERLLSPSCWPINGDIILIVPCRNGSIDANLNAFGDWCRNEFAFAVKEPHLADESDLGPYRKLRQLGIERASSGV